MLNKKQTKRIEQYNKEEEKRKKNIENIHEKIAFGRNGKRNGSCLKDSFLLYRDSYPLGKENV